METGRRDREPAGPANRSAPERTPGAGNRVAATPIRGSRTARAAPEIVLVGVPRRPERHLPVPGAEGRLLLRAGASCPPGDAPPLASLELQLHRGDPERGQIAEVIPLGEIPEDPALWQALASGRPAAEVRPGCTLVRGVRAVAARLLRALEGERRPPPRSPASGAAVTREPAADTP